jgi:hypothetical protein
MRILRQFAFPMLVTLFIASAVAMSFADDPPSRVARLKYISGQVSMQPGGVNDWAAATINRPMTTADRLWTDKDARAELHLGSAAMRMDSETSLTLTNLSDSTVQMELDQGTLNLQVARLFHGEMYEVDTPNTAFTILKAGDYRFDVDSNGDTTLVTVWKGNGVATGSGDAVRVESRKQVRFTGGMSLVHAIYNLPREDGFDEWCRVRGDRELHSISVRYVSPDVVGYEDLDGYGSWREVPNYGSVWFPARVAAGWAPYSAGHWIWVEPWGWTWVDDAPWGFAPFHYGRWVFVGSSWAWAPGPVSVRPCYAPALVAWIGSSGAGVGWFPLGYGEPYIPNYRVSRGYFQTVNVSNTRITNITYVTNNYYNVDNVRITNIHYVNQRVPGGMTVVDNDVLVNSRQINHNVFIDHDRDWNDHHDRWVTAGPPVPPSRNSVLGAHAGQPARMPERFHDRPVVVNMKPPERHVPFEAERGDLENHGGRPLDSAEQDRLRKRMPEMSRGDQSASRNDSRPSPDRQDGRDSNQGEHRGQVAGNGRDNNDGERRGPVANGERGQNDGKDHRWNVPRPPGRDDNHGQPGSGGDYAGDNRDQDQRNHEQNSRGQNSGSQNSGSDQGHWADNDRNDRNPQRNGGPDHDGTGENASTNQRYPHPFSNGRDHGQGNPGQQAQGPEGQPDNGHNSPQQPANANNGDRANSGGWRQFPHPPQSNRNNDQGSGEQQAQGPQDNGHNSAQQPSNANNGDRRNSGGSHQSSHPPQSNGNDEQGSGQQQAQGPQGQQNNGHNSPQQPANANNGDRGNSGGSHQSSHPPQSNGNDYQGSGQQQAQGPQGQQNNGHNSPQQAANANNGDRGNSGGSHQVPRPPQSNGNSDQSSGQQAGVPSRPTDNGGGAPHPAQPVTSSNGRNDNSGSDRQVPRPAYGARGAGSSPAQQTPSTPSSYNNRPAGSPSSQQAAERPSPRPAQAESHASAPASRPAQAQRSPQPVSHPAPNSDAGSSHGGSQFQDRGHEKPQDR